MSNLRVLVTGASIAGPTAAYWLAKMGARVTVIERYPQLRTGGQYVDIRATGVSVMQKMAGLEEAVRDNSTPIEGFSLVRENGRPYGTMKPSGNPEQQTLVSEYEILRGNLSRVLFGLTNTFKNVDYVFGEQLASIQQDEEHGGPITVKFSNGLPPSKYDLVVACDGAMSRTRSLGLGCHVQDHVFPLNSWVVYFTINKDLLRGSRIVEAYSTAGGRFLAVGPDLTGANRVVMMGINRRNDPDAMGEFRKFNRLGPEALKKYVAEYFKGVGWKSDEIFQGMMESDDFYGSEMIQVRTPTLRRGRVVLVGDAGYASGPAGTGTSLALVGAYILAGEIGKHPNDLAAGLRAYEEQMRPLISEMQKLPLSVPAILAPQSAPATWLRNAGFSFVCRTKLPTLFRWLFGSASARSDQFKLPEYVWDT